MKLLRTICLDASDESIFPAVADPGEWAISGTFVFADRDLAALGGKELTAFRSGFLGFPSLGWSTLAQVVEVDEAARCAAVDTLAHCLMERFGAPDIALARAAAAEEIEFVASLCDHPLDTLIALERSVEGDAIREQFRSLQQRQGQNRWRAYSVDSEPEDAPTETIDLMQLARDRAI